jgi:glycosyltransferase involved in cell wall biosynthesis
MLGAERANRDRFDVVVCYIRDQRDTAFQPAGRAKELAVHYVEVHERHSLDPGVWPALKRLVAEERIDIVHAHEYKTDLLAWLLARRTGIAPLSTAHGWTGQSARERLVYYPADKRLLARFPRVIAVSTEIRNELVRHGARPDRITVILNAIDPGQFRRIAGEQQAARARFGIAPDEVVAGAVGRLERQKRFDLLIEAVAALAPAWPRLRLVIAGDGSLRGALQAQVDRLGLAGICRFLGHRTDVTDLHHAFDLFVQSSEYEGTPNAVLEAMAMETPLVATDAGGTREIALPDVHGLVVPIQDVTALRHAIDRVLRDPAAARARAAAARARIETDLSFETRTRKLEAVYDALMSGVAAHA